MKVYFKTSKSVHFIVLILALLNLWGCKSNEAEVKEELISFKLELNKNATILSQDLVGIIENNKISFTVPKGIYLKEVVLNCVFIGEGVYIGGLRVENNTTKTEIKNGTNVELRLKNGGVINYIIAFVEFEDLELSMSKFMIEKKNNPQLARDIVFTINENDISGNLKKSYFNVIPTFITNAKSVEINNVNQVSGINKVDLKQDITYTLTSSKGFRRQYKLIIYWDDRLPQITITTDGRVAITSTDTYIQANIEVNGNGIFSDYSGTTKIRGRGNTTWTLPKKPYRLKLDTKSSIFGLSSEKDWVLLANYLDGTHTLNAIAMKAGKLLNMPYTNNIIPVEVTLNGQYQGCYMFTEQVEAESNRVNVGTGGVLLELDKNFDEPWEFKSSSYQLPVMIKYPDLLNQAEIVPIRADFEKMEALVFSPNFPNNNYLDYIDSESLANYLIVYMLTDNQEINHPKSTFMYKTKTGKYNMGPIWDFDWAYGYEGTFVHFNNYSSPLFWTTPSVGTKFFSKIMSDPQIRTLLKQKWADFKANKFLELLTFVDEYTFVIEGARNRDYQKWKRGNAIYKSDINNLKIWLQSRANYLNGYIGSF